MSTRVLVTISKFSIRSDSYGLTADISMMTNDPASVAALRDAMTRDLAIFLEIPDAPPCGLHMPATPDPSQHYDAHADVCHVPKASGLTGPTEPCPQCRKVQIYASETNCYSCGWRRS